MAFTNFHPVEIEITRRRKLGQSYLDISNAMGIPEGTIAGRIARARAEAEGRIIPSHTGFGEALRRQRLRAEATRLEFEKLGIAVIEPYA